ncbi:formylmethanofuran dehydrogenase subunit E family protein [Sulfobacillus thermotolerans]|uniref:formylmethanofuran dehydrogenase subunit E family protein n=1 Tax=Sulfobacillus thermotolerans TaxID=338644 RepID=UPI003367CE34
MVLPLAAQQTELPTFWVRDTVSSHGRYADRAKKITGIDLVRFHGHACDGLFRGMYALSVAFPALFPDGVIDRTDMRVMSRNSPCLGDVAAYLTGGRIRFGTQDVDNSLGVWFLLQRMSTGQTVKVHEEPGFFPTEIGQGEAQLAHLNGDDLSRAVTALQDRQNQWVEHVLLPSSPSDHYFVEPLDFTGPDVPFEHIGVRTDILYKNVPEHAALARGYKALTAIAA